MQNHNFFLILILFLNVTTVLGVIICKTLYKKNIKTITMANITLGLAILFTTYTLSLALLAIYLLLKGQIGFGLLISALTIIPYIIGKFSTYKKSELFINLQIIALIINLTVIAGKYY